MCVGMDTGHVRDAAYRLRVAIEKLDTIGDDLARAADLAGLSSEVAGPRRLVTELDEEINLVQLLLDARASMMELADSGYSTGGAHLVQVVNSLIASLEASLLDGVGSSGSAAELREYYTARALERAGIDPSEWRPGDGLDANAHIVALVYEYYADMYRADPDSLWWAGMAAVIGPSFFGGFQDLEMFADLFGHAGDIADKLKYPSIVIPGSNPLAWDITAMAADDLDRELRWYQTQLLSMQQEIFYDMAPAHEAYLDGGMLAIERLYADDDYGFGPATIEAWRQIDEGRRTGDTALVASGNRVLLLREQRYVIDDDYKLMLDRPVTGEAVTYLMTAIGAPSVPGAKTYPEFDPLKVSASQSVHTPKTIPIIPFVWHQSIPYASAGATITVTTPLPDGNIARFDERWALIEHDTLPIWVDLAENRQADVLDLLATPVDARARDYTIINRADELVHWAVTGWDVDVDVELKVGW